VDVSLVGEVGHPAGKKRVNDIAVLPFHPERLDRTLYLAAGGEAGRR
jgi:hypothetical protein